MNLDPATIAAISTPLGEGGIGIVRLSGPEAINIVEEIFKPNKGPNLSQLPSLTVHLGKIYEAEKTVDEVLVTVFRNPQSYTREDVVEISGHGGIVATQKILSLCLKKGAKLAPPGEFTKRAFLNGRLDLTQAEAVAELIRAKTDQALKVAASQLEGRLSRKIKEIRSKIISLLATIEVNLDYAEDDLPAISEKTIQAEISSASGEIEKLLESAFTGKILHQGLRIGIVGKPNVGKSSLWNALLEEEKAIVTPLPGTTRDVLEGEINLGGIAVLFYDTAGIRFPQDTIEELAVERSRKKIEQADLILFVLDGSLALTEEDKTIARELKDKKFLVIINKCDLAAAFDKKKAISFLVFADQPIILTVSATQGKGLTELKNTIYDIFMQGKICQPELLITNIRHEQALRQAQERLSFAGQSLSGKFSLEFVALDLRQALNFLGEIIGETVSEDILKEIFSRFCVGK